MLVRIQRIQKNVRNDILNNGQCQYFRFLERIRPLESHFPFVSFSRKRSGTVSEPRAVATGPGATFRNPAGLLDPVATARVGWRMN
jgi:hypothetical protein